MTVAIVGLMLGLWVEGASAQEIPLLPRVGILSPYAAEVSSFEDDVKRGLTELGYVEGQSIAFETVFADGRTDYLPALASGLVERKVDIIVTTTAPAVRAAKQATSEIPIVIGGVDDAVEQGFAASLAEPGGNLTGTSWLNA
jgi:putative ABC transport system substrate-binding protein